MTTAAGGDLPDWTQAVNNPGTYLGATNVIPGAQLVVPVNSYNSIVANINAQGLNNPIRASFDWVTAQVGGQEVTVNTISSVGFPGFTTEIGYESPVYAGLLIITNLGPTALTVQLVGSSRTVPSPRVLYSSVPGRSFNYTGPIVAGTGVVLGAGDNLTPWYASNATSTIVVGSNASGNWFYNYIDAGGTSRSFFLCTAAANTNVVVTFGLPQGQGSFAFVPTTSVGGGTATVLAVASQL